MHCDGSKPEQNAAQNHGDDTGDPAQNTDSLAPLVAVGYEQLTKETRTEP